MNELAPTKLKKPLALDSNSELAGLAETLKFLNNPEITGAQVPTGVDLAKPGTDKTVKHELPGEIQAASQAIDLPEDKIPTSGTNRILARQPGAKFFFTGRLKSGKDYVANQLGASIHGFADPLYYLANHFFGLGITATSNKDLPGVRSFLQTLGQWGRGTVNEQYPVTAARACFVTMVRSLHAAGVIDGYKVTWDEYGRNENLWLDACVRRIDGMDRLSRVAITNCRFPNELEGLKTAGFQHWHVICSTTTWKQRLSEAKLTPDSSAVKDYSEKLAAMLDADVTKILSHRHAGNKLRVIWNDNVAPPSSRVYTLAQFLNEHSQEKLGAETGE